MEWPARSPDLNPIEHVWDALGRYIAALNAPPQTLATLATGLQEQWLSFPTEMIDRIIVNVTHRFIAVAFMTFGPRCVICNRVPLRSLGISRLRISSTGTPTFNLGLSEGAPGNSNMLKSSTEYDVPC
ncbi:hypothetical protein AVEN_13598-1 [Araneus ventricosus]|uniref:Tc1-like transposase DDE domain-containing protein n=1 Tax=Araneus ventricosus TaxID=182803 RepID=A0A4Y2D517_ARAVE|nr:hypothetical protein AVEN_13598-1 [Araneus ventricosus]